MKGLFVILKPTQVLNGRMKGLFVILMPNYVIKDNGLWEDLIAAGAWDREIFPLREKREKLQKSDEQAPILEKYKVQTKTNLQRKEPENPNSNSRIWICDLIYDGSRRCRKYDGRHRPATIHRRPLPKTPDFRRALRRSGQIRRNEVRIVELGSGKLEIEESAPNSGLSEQGRARLGSADAGELSAAHIRRRGTEIGGAAGRRRCREGVSASGRRLCGEFQGIQCEQY